MTEVALIDAETFAALTAPAAAPETLADVPVPPTPAPISAPEAPTQEAPVEAVPPRPDPPAAATSGAVPPALRPVARPEPPQIEAAPQPLQPPDDTPGEDLDLATPAPAPRVAPVPNLRPDPADAPDDVPTVATRPSPTADRALPSQERAAAPPRATDRIITEADEADETVTTSLRPRPRPNRPAPQPAQPAEQTGGQQDAVAAAVAAAVADGGTVNRQGSGLAASGPPLTQGEKDALRLSVQNCWVIDVGSEAGRIEVTVAFSLSEDGRVEGGRVDLIADSGGAPAAVNAAYEAARRAVLRCQRSGYDLPVEKYAHWRNVEIVFDPSKMRN